MKERYHPCEAEEHVAECSGIGETKDHFTPKCVARLLGWNHHQIEAPENIQYLDGNCHKNKDKDTAKRFDVLKKQLRGEVFTFEKHRKIFNGET